MTKSILIIKTVVLNILTKCCPSEPCNGDHKSQYKQKVSLLEKHVLCDKNQSTHDQCHHCG